MTKCFDNAVIKRCSRCILPETIPNITFDQNGVCNHCIGFETTDKKSQFDFKKANERFTELIKQAKEYAIKNGSKYDVAVSLSGGRDSTYIAWKLATEYKLRVLCINYANPYTSLQAKKNIENLIKVIGGEAISFSYPNRVHERSFESILKAWIKKPDFGTICLLCLACKPIYYEIFQIAHQNKVSVIFDGANIMEVTTFKTESMGAKDGGKLLSPKILIKFLIKFMHNLNYINLCNIKLAIKSLMSLHGKTPYLKYRYPHMKKEDYFFLFPYQEAEINETLRKIGWKKADDNKSPWRMDCEIDAFKNYMYEKIINVTQKDDLFSKNIRYGLMTRDEALKRLGEAEVNLVVVDKILNSVGLNRKQMDDACLIAKRRLCA